MLQTRELKRAAQKVVESMEAVLRELRIEEGLDTVSEILGGGRLCAQARAAAEQLRINAARRLAEARAEAKATPRTEPRSRYEGPPDRKAAALPPGMRGYNYSYNEVTIATKSLVPDEGEE